MSFIWLIIALCIKYNVNHTKNFKKLWDKLINGSLTNIMAGSSIEALDVTYKEKDKVILFIISLKTNNMIMLKLLYKSGELL